MQRAKFPALNTQDAKANPHSIRYIARLVYDHHCQFCGRHSAALIPEILLRICKTCRDEQVVHISDVRDCALHPATRPCSLAVWDYPDSVKSSRQRRTHSKHPYILRDDLFSISMTLEKLDPDCASSRRDEHEGVPGSHVILKNPLHRTIQVALENDPRACLEYIHDRKAYVAAVRSEVPSLERFDNVLKAQRTKELADIKNSQSQIRFQRTEVITKRLLVLEVDPRDVPSDDPFVKVARPLPKGGWTHAEPQLLQAAEGRKAERELQEPKEKFEQCTKDFFAVQMREHTLTLPPVVEVVNDSRLKPLWEPPESIVDDSTAVSNQALFRSVIIERCLPRRLTYFAMCAEALYRARLESIDLTVFHKACALEPFGKLRPYTPADQVSPAPEPMSEEELKVVDGLLADTRNHFICCGKSWTYAELSAHMAQQNDHVAIGYARKWSNFSSTNSFYDGLKPGMSIELLRTIRDVATELGIPQSTRAALNDWGEMFTCRGAKARTWDDVVSHHLRSHSFWHRGLSWSSYFQKRGPIFREPGSTNVKIRVAD